MSAPPLPYLCVGYFWELRNESNGWINPKMVFLNAKNGFWLKNPRRRRRICVTG
jgi:hypothetical protein